MTTGPFSADVRSKAHRYAQDGAVRADDTADGVWWVQGTRAEPYRVQVFFHGPDQRNLSGATCSCRFGSNNAAGITGCSHVAATLLVIREGRRHADRLARLAVRAERIRATADRRHEIDENGSPA